MFKKSATKQKNPLLRTVNSKLHDMELAYYKIWLLGSNNVLDDSEITSTRALQIPHKPAFFRLQQTKLTNLGRSKRDFFIPGCQEVLDKRQDLN